MPIMISYILFNKLPRSASETVSNFLRALWIQRMFIKYSLKNEFFMEKDFWEIGTKSVGNLVRKKVCSITTHVFNVASTPLRSIEASSPNTSEKF